MATQTKNTKKVITKEALVDNYIDYVLTEGHEPKSVFAFAKHYKFSEADFYEHFNSFTVLEKEIWTDFVNTTIASVKADDNYQGFSVREKLLSFFYTYVEVIKGKRSYVTFRIKNIKSVAPPSWSEGLRTEFKSYMLGLINEGVESNEIKLPPVINDKIDDAFYIQFVYIMRVWVNDESKDFQNTDAAIEKSVNLVFDLLGRGPIDAIIDFAKFAFKTKIN
ncbi:MAG: TetR family transcriptional regulator C-terminal domain-containing protein [Luteibaculaceae bacterium]